MDALDLKYSKAILLKILENGGKVKKTDLLSLIKNYQTLSNIVDHLINDNYLKPIVKKGRGKTITLELTEKGRYIAEQLKRVNNFPEKPIDISKAEFDKMTKDWKRLTALTHVNVLDDHVVLKEYNFDGQGHDRLVTIYVSINHDKVMRLYCEVDQSTTCWHVQYAWTLPEVQAWVQFHLQKGDITRTDNQKEEK